MKNEALYNKTVSILVDAYFNDTLQHGNCYACAVGNIVAGNLGYLYCTRQLEEVMVKHHTLAWVHNPNFYTTDMDVLNGWFDAIGCGIFSTYKMNEAAKMEIDATGYSGQELAKIEYSFEDASEGKNDDEWMFNGLMAVIEVLDQIHENNDTLITQSSKQRFVKQTA